MSVAVLVIIAVVAVVASTLTLIVRGASAGKLAESQTRQLRQLRHSAGPLPGLTVRPLEASDRLAWRALWDSYCDFYGASLSEDVTNATWSRILDPASTIQGWGAFDGEGKLVGFAHTVLHPHTWSEKTLCYLEDLYVAPLVRGRDVGHSIITFLWRKAEEAGWGRLYWHTEATNVTARRLYDRFRPADGYVRYTLTL